MLMWTCVEDSTRTRAGRGSGSTSTTLSPIGIFFWVIVSGGDPPFWTTEDNPKHQESLSFYEEFDFRRSQVVYVDVVVKS